MAMSAMPTARLRDPAGRARHGPVVVTIEIGCDPAANGPLAKAVKAPVLALIE